MARILYNPTARHNCFTELDQLDVPAQQPLGAIAECSCSLQYVVSDHPVHGRYWARSPMHSSPPGIKS